jgi:hypothetical protein
MGGGGGVGGYLPDWIPHVDTPNTARGSCDPAGPLNTFTLFLYCIRNTVYTVIPIAMESICCYAQMMFYQVVPFYPAGIFISYNFSI